MSPLSEAATPRGNVLVVDDNPTNLKLLDDMLRRHGYDVRSFPRGRLALAGAEEEPPDLILLDITMPEMDGYEVCARLKSNARLSGIPVIFLSALNGPDDKVKGFRAGGVDYISKPFQFEEVQARVETHIALRRARQAEHDLTERTLGGAVGILWELVQLTSPVLANRARAIQDVVLWITRQLALADSWQCELAARLCLLGCVSLPEEVFERAYAGQELSPEEHQMFAAHPETAARLVSQIPRLDVVAEIIRRQLATDRSTVMSQAQPGADILHLAVEMNRSTYRGIASATVLSRLRMSGTCSPAILDALASYSPSKVQFEKRQLRLRDLEAGMALEEDIVTADTQLLIFKSGTVLTRTWIERLNNFAKFRGLKDLVQVRVPIEGTHA